MPQLASVSLLAVIALAAPACKSEPHPWETGDAEPPRPPLRASATSLVPELPSPESSAPSPTADVPPTPPVRVGGPWVRCYGGFHATGQPVVDVTRLALACGPENGMKRLSQKTFEGDVREGGPPSTDSFPGKRGECYRVFAASGPGLQDLDVAVRSSRGAVIAADHGDDAWPIVQPDRPFCPLEDDVFTVEIVARRGGGHFASEVWVLKTAPREPPRGLRTEE